MDKFVVRTPRSEGPPPMTSSRSGASRQKTLFQLRGVVVIEDLERAVEMLKDERTSNEDKADRLRKLLSKRPATELIAKTGIGKVVRKLRKHSDQSVAQEAEKVFSAWKEDIERKVELQSNKIEVQSDAETTKLRGNAVKLLVQACSKRTGKVFPKQHKLISGIEKEIFAQCKSLVSTKYRQTTRKVVFALKHKEDLRNRFMDGEISAKELVDEYL